jgi:penicillin-binding protein 2
VVIVAFGENSGGYGGTVSAPMVKRLMETFFHRRQGDTTTTAAGKTGGPR